jgi:hypothetical protein
MTPVSEEVALLAIKRIIPEPINVYCPEIRQIERRARPFEGDDGF